MNTWKAAAISIAVVWVVTAGLYAARIHRFNDLWDRGIKGGCVVEGDLLKLGKWWLLEGTRK